MREEEFVKAVEGAGGTVYLVGGWVRDHLRGATPRDKDFVITGLEREAFAELFPAASLIGHAFPVYLVEIDGVRSEVSFARRERTRRRIIFPKIPCGPFVQRVKRRNWDLSSTRVLRC